MIPQVPEYLVTFEASIRPLVAAIALGLIWMGATRLALMLHGLVLWRLRRGSASTDRLAAA